MPLLGWLRVRRSPRLGCADAPAAASDARHEGDRCRDEGRWIEAAVSYRIHLKQYPRDFAIWVQAGNCLKEGASFDEALAAYRHAIELDGSDADVFLQLGHLQKIMGRRDDAIEAYRTSLARRRDGNPALGELTALGVIAPVEPAPPLGGRAQPVDVDQALRTIGNQLHRLIEARVLGEVANPPVPSSPPVSPPTPLAQPTAGPPLPPIAAAREGDPSVFLVVGSTGSPMAQPSRFLCDLARAFVQLGEAVRFVQWSAEDNTLQLLTRGQLEVFGLTAGGGERTTGHPAQGDPRVVVAPQSCGDHDWLLIPETVSANPAISTLAEMDLILAGRRLGLRSAFVFHGAGPLRLPKQKGPHAVAYEQYMQALLLADAVAPVSTLAANDLKGFFAQHQNAERGAPIRVISPPASAQEVSTEKWLDYIKRIRGLLADAADSTRHVTSLYFWIGPGVSALDAKMAFAGRLARALTRRGVALVPVDWDVTKRSLIATDKVLPGGSSWADWIEPGQPEAPRWLVFPDGTGSEVLAEVVTFAKARRLRTAALLQEVVGQSDEELPSASAKREMLAFEALAGTDKVLVASERRFRHFHRFLMAWRGKVHSAEHRFKVIAAPHESPGQQRRAIPKRPRAEGVCVLAMISAQRAADPDILLDAAERAATRSASRLLFTFLGGSSRMSASDAATLEARIQSIPQARWVKDTDGGSFDKLLEVADFLVLSDLDGEMAQLVAESLWLGLPCVVHADVGRSPTAGPAGLVFADMESRPGLTEAILRLADHDWRRCLAQEALDRPVRSWDDYARDITLELATDRLTDGLLPLEVQQGRDVYATLVNLQKRPKLSLCISTYNRAGWLEISLNNIFSQIAQPRGDLEVLVVDNASADHTSEVVKPHLGRPDFRYVRNPANVGMLGNLAVTAQRARGEYVWILGDDDLTRPGVIEKVLQIIDRHPGIALIYMNYGYTTEANPGSVTDLAAFLANYNLLEPPGPDQFAAVKQLAAKCENFFTAIYSHVSRRDHALKSYCQDTSGRIFSTMLSCVPTAYYVLNFMADEPAYWIGEPALVVNSNVSWQDYGVLLDLEQLPRTWDLAERMGTDPVEVDCRRANRLWLVEMMWREIFENDRAGNSAYFSASRVLMRLKHLKELDTYVPKLMSVYERAHQVGHPAATMPPEELFSAFKDLPGSPPIANDGTT